MTRGPARRYAVAAALAAVLALHLALVMHFVPPALVLGDEPIAGLDLDTHYRQTLRAVEAYRSSGRVWSYDPHSLAGQTSGAIFDANNKLIELVAISLDKMGVPPHRSFNLFLLLAHLLVPLVVFASARLFMLAPPAAVGAALLASLIWYFDALSHWCFYVGMISWGSASYLAMLPIGLFYRWVRKRNTWLLVALFPLMALLHHLHAYIFFVLLVPMTLMYWRARSTLSGREHATVWALVLTVIVANAWWVMVAVKLWHYILDSGYYLDASPAFLLYDYLGLLKEPDIHGVIAVRSSFRFLAFGAAALGLLAWRRGGDDRFGVLASALGATLLIGYFGRWIAPLRQLQPYRFVLPAIYLAILPASAWLASTLKTLRLRRPAAPVAGLLVLLSFVALPRMVRDVLYFLPGWVPRPTRFLPAPPPNINSAPGFGSIWWPQPFDFRHHRLIGSDRFAIEMVRKLDDGRGRWLVEWWEHGERLAWATKAQILGGFREINLAHSDANLLRKHPDGSPPGEDGLRAYFERYNVQWVIVANPLPKLEERRDLLTPVSNLFNQRIYRTNITPSWFVGGGPGTVKAQVDKLTIVGSKGGDLVLKYHYLETLQCRPGCTLYKAPVEGDRVGFIGVRGAPPDFEIINP